MKTQTFTLAITLGNDAMSDAPAIAEALRAVADKLDSDFVGCDPIEPTAPGEYGTTIYDYNGNAVGHWEVTPERPDTGDSGVLIGIGNMLKRRDMLTADELVEWISDTINKAGIDTK